MNDICISTIKHAPEIWLRYMVSHTFLNTESELKIV